MKLSSLLPADNFLIYLSTAKVQAITALCNLSSVLAVIGGAKPTNTDVDLVDGTNLPF